MNTRPVRLFSWLLAAALAGCQTATPLATVPHDRSIAVSVSTPAAKRVQALVSRQALAEPDHYIATLLEWDGDSFEPTDHTVESTVQTVPQFHFDHLASARYQVAVVGYDAGNHPLTNEGRSDEIDLTANDVDLTRSVNIALSMRDTEFSGTLMLPTNDPGAQRLPDWATTVTAVVKEGTEEIASVTYTPGQHASVKNLHPGVTYTVELTVSDGDAQSETKTYTYLADDTKSTLDDLLYKDLFDAVYTTGDEPFDLAVDALGATWIGNYSSGDVTRISATGAVTLTPTGAGANGVAVDKNGYAWVANYDANTVTRISPTGVPQTFDTDVNPASVAVDAAGNAWVANIGSDTVQRFTPTGVMTSYDVGDGPCPVRVDKDGNAWVVNGGSDTVTRIDPTISGGDMRSYSTGHHPNDLAVDKDGNVWVAVTYGGLITRITAGGAQSNFDIGTDAYNVAVDKDGNAWFTNTGPNTVTRVTPAGTPTAFSVGTEPYGVAVDAAGNVWVANHTSKNVTRIATDGNTTTYNVGDYVSTIALDADGNAWVPDAFHDRVLKFVP